MPKFTPDAISMTLFGPGVIEVAKAKSAKAAIRSNGTAMMPFRSIILT
jgi:hypothetical protein